MGKCKSNEYECEICCYECENAGRCRDNCTNNNIKFDYKICFFFSDNKIINTED